MPDWIAWTLAVVGSAAIIYGICKLAHNWREACGPEHKEKP